MLLMSKWCTAVKALLCRVCWSQVELPAGTADEAYLSKLQHALDAVAAMMPQPHLIIYNAGTDILEGDPLGR